MASHRYERCWSGASRLPTARSSLQAAYSQLRPCGALVPAEAGPNFAAWWAVVRVCEQLTRGCYAVCLGRGSNSRPSDRESRALTIEPPCHHFKHFTNNEITSDNSFHNDIDKHHVHYQSNMIRLHRK